MQLRLSNNTSWLKQIWRLAALIAVSAGLCAVPDNRASAQEVVATGEEVADQDEVEQLILDLGTFRVRELRPTRNQTIEIDFSLQVKLSSEVNQRELEKLEACKHRLRDQVITAVRTLHTADFREVELSRMRRVIQFRLEQILRATVVENLLLSDYKFSVD